MTRKDYVLIARTIVYLNLSMEVKKQIAEAFAARLSAANSNFDRQRFITACLE